MLIDLVSNFAGLVAGATIGYAFGLLQQAALRRNEKRQLEGKLHSGLSLVPGAGARVAYLLLTLILVQVICPLLFRDGTQWWVSGGLVAGYGWTLFKQLQLKRKAARL
jgi:uncharacterized BrkB/YihY/UPF0761 family membrane protein